MPEGSAGTRYETRLHVATHTLHSGQSDCWGTGCVCMEAIAPAPLNKVKGRRLARTRSGLGLYDEEAESDKRDMPTHHLGSATDGRRCRRRPCLHESYLYSEGAQVGIVAAAGSASGQPFMRTHTPSI